MIPYILVAVGSGVLSVFNKMVNVKSTIYLGNVNGTFINYLEATIISFIAVLCTGHINELTVGYIKTVATYLYVGSITGLIALILLVIGTKKTTVMISTVVVLIGQLSTSIVFDHIFFHEDYSILKILGIFFVISGMAFRERIIKKSNINETEQKGDEKAV